MAPEDDEEVLRGGAVNPSVVRIGETVRRTPSEATPAVHDLLRHLEMNGFDGAPRALGFDEDGREVLSYIDGHVSHDEEWPDVLREDSGLVRTTKVGRVRTCRMEPAGLSVAERWIASRRSLWERRLDRLGDLLAEPEGN